VLAFDVIKFYDNVIRKRIAYLSKIPYAFPPAPKKIKAVEKQVDPPVESNAPITDESPQSDAKK
ncbi:MAG: hypothetical protein ABIQ93_03085, partial [Saprospiraceae bacterium]